VSNATFRNGSNISTGASNRSVSSSMNPSALDAPPLTRMRSMRSESAVALKKSNVFWISSMTFSLTARSTARTSAAATPSIRVPLLQAVGLFEGQVQLLLQGFRIRVAADGEIAREDRLVAVEGC
jgi:hypothetical protein